MKVINISINKLKVKDYPYDVDAWMVMGSISIRGKKKRRGVEFRLLTQYVKNLTKSSRTECLNTLYTINYKKYFLFMSLSIKTVERNNILNRHRTT